MRGGDDNSIIVPPPSLDTTGLSPEIKGVEEDGEILDEPFCSTSPGSPFLERSKGIDMAISSF